MERALDLLAPELFRDPHPTYAQLRAEAPVYWSEQLQSWVLTRYDDVSRLLRDPRITVGWPQLPMARELTLQEQADLRYLEQLRNHMLGSLNGADHTRQRTLAHSAFTPRVVEQIRAVIQAQADALIDPLAARGQIELIADLAQPLPLAVIFQLMGVPPELQGLIYTGAHMVSLSSSLHDPAPGQLHEMRRAAYLGEQCVRTLIAERSVRPQDDLLTRLVYANQAGQRLNDDELCALVYTLLLGGFETIVSLLSNGMLALLRHPDQLARLLAEPALIESAVEELLRFEPTLFMTIRRPSEDILVGDAVIPAGQTMLLVLGAANRDPAQFPDPDRLELAHTPTGISALATGSTSASGRRWGGSRARSRSARCCGVCPASGWRSRPKPLSGCPPCFCAASRPCPWCLNRRGRISVGMPNRDGPHGDRADMLAE